MKPSEYLLFVIPTGVPRFAGLVPMHNRIGGTRKEPALETSNW